MIKTTSKKRGIGDKSNYSKILTKSNSQVLWKQNKKYNINNETNEFYKNNSVITVQLPDIDCFIDTDETFLEFDVEFFIAGSNPSPIQPVEVQIRSIMDFFRSIKVTHDSNSILYQDDHFNKHWLHDVITSTNEMKYNKIQDQMLGFVGSYAPFNSYKLPACFPALYTTKMWETSSDYKKISDNNLYFHSFVLYPSENSSKNKISFKLPLSWIPFFKSINKALFPALIHKNLKIEFEIDDFSKCFKQHLIDYTTGNSWSEVFESQYVDFKMNNFKLNLSQIFCNDTIMNKVSNTSTEYGIRWYFYNTKCKFKSDVSSYVDLTFQEPINSILYLKCIPYIGIKTSLNTNLIIHQAGDLFETVGVKSSHGVHSFNSNTNSDKKDVNIANLFDYKNSFDNLFLNWQFTLGNLNFPYDKINENFDLTDNYFDIKSTYFEMLKSYNYVNKTATLKYRNFENGFCYQAVQNLQREQDIFNSGYQCDRDNMLTFKGTFLQNSLITAKKDVYFFVTHIKEIICVGDKILIKE